MLKTIEVKTVQLFIEIAYMEDQAGTYLPENVSNKIQVKTIALIEMGAHILMLVILTIETVTHPYRKSVELILMWTYFYLNHAGCIASSIYLYHSLLKMDISRIQFYMKWAVVFYIIWFFANIGEVVVIEFPDGFVTAIVVALALYKLLSFLIVHAFLKRCRESSTSHPPLSDTDIQTVINGNESQQSNFPGESFDTLPFNKSFEIPFENLSMESNLLGEGRYGQVFKGTVKTDSVEGPATVAVKTIDSNASGCCFRSLLAELKILSRIGQHDHIVNLVGACTRELNQRKLYIVVEFCAHGSLDKYIKARRESFQDMIIDDHIIVRNSMSNNNYMQLYEPVTTLDILKWAYQTSCGMDYLANKNIIHGDIAARNILLTESMSIKIADFGLSRSLYDKIKYIKKQEDYLPWRSMALESLCSMEFSTKTDVWSYGVTLWELFTLCETPYRELNFSAQFKDMLESGYRLERPIFCTSGIYDLMCSCWQFDPTSRPQFRDICEYLLKIINDARPAGSFYCYSTSNSLYYT